MTEMKRKFVQRGTVVEVLTTVEKEELQAKDVLQTIQTFEQEIQKANQQLIQMATQKEQVEKNLEHTEKLLKDMSKFKGWAENYQIAKAKKLIPEVAEQLQKEIDSNFKAENGEETEDQIKQTKYLQFQTRLSTHPDVANELSQEMIRKYVYTEPLISNPF